MSAGEPVYLPIPGFVGHYAVSGTGTVVSLRTKSFGNDVARHSPFKMKQRKVLGYWRVTLSVPGKRSNDPGGRLNASVHRLVALAFVDPFPEDNMVVAHLDGDADNNHWSNLAFTSQQENIGMKEAHGTVIAGDAHPLAIEKEACVRVLSLVVQETPVAKIAQEMDIAPSTVHHIRRGKSLNAREAAVDVWRTHPDPLLLLGLFG